MGHAPRLILTGAAGFLGRRLIQRLAESWRIVAIDRELPSRVVRSTQPQVSWHAIDVADAPALTALGAELRRAGGAQAVVHLAAHYDFTGRPHPEYQRTNVEGTRVLLDACEGLGVERFVFASSLAACDFPRAGSVLSEASPADGVHPYARSKSAGEALVRRETRFPTVVVRFAALYSDWCEYSPLYHFLGTWTSGRWNSNVLGGRGRSAVSYLHVRDALIFLDRVLALRRELEPAEVLLASPNGVASHAELFRAATAYADGEARTPVHVPKPVAWTGMIARDLAGRARGRRPFERPWMARMIDRRLEVDAQHTHVRLGWVPRARLDVVRRIPFLIENQRSDPGTWAARNEAVLHDAQLPPQVQILRLFEEHEEALFLRFSRELAADHERFPTYAGVGEGELEWNHRQLLRSLAHSVRTRHRGHFRAYCHDLAERRVRQGLAADELSSALCLFERLCREELAAGPRAAALAAPLHELVTRTVEFGLDGVEAAYEEFGSGEAAAP